MAAHRKAETTTASSTSSVEAGEAAETVNEVRLVGRVTQDPQERTLPSGDRLWTFRVAVPRTGGPAGSRATVDALDCSAWTARCRRAVASWRAGDLVEVTGAVRRRFFRTGAGAVSRVEVKVATARVIRRRSTA